MEIGGKIVILVIALMVLGIMIYAGYYFFTGQAIPFFNMIPSLNATGGKTTSIEIFRYNLQSREVQYYDGTNWNKFGEVTISDKKIREIDIITPIEDAYYTYKRNVPTDAIWKLVYMDNNVYSSTSGSSSITNPSALLYTDKAYYEAKVEFLNSQVVFSTNKYYYSVLKINVYDVGEKVYPDGKISVNHNTKIGEFFIDYTDNMVESKSTTGNEEIFSKLIKDNSRAIYPAAREWRDLVFKVPIQISWLPSNPETGSGD
ncbi:MAG: hypothetical protein Q8L29_04300, partial [archaeon]|nr:hypothetical protein [archaeon]